MNKMIHVTREEALMLAMALAFYEDQKWPRREREAAALKSLIRKFSSDPMPDGFDFIACY